MTMTMKLFTSALAGMAFVAGCATPVAPPARGNASQEADMRSHAFEKHLYVADQNISHLSQREWAEIQAQWCSEQGDYVFQSATRKNNDLVVVRLISKGHSLHRTGLKLFFEKKGDRWMENTARAKGVGRIIPFFQ
jgi:predicted amidohydrolase